MAEHDELDRLEHELHTMEFNRPYDVVEIRKLRGKFQAHLIVQQIQQKHQDLNGIL